MKIPTAPGLMTPETAALYLGLSENTLKTWRCQKTGPRYVRLGRRVMYREIDLQAFISQQVTSTNIMPNSEGEQVTEPCQKSSSEVKKAPTTPEFIQTEKSIGGPLAQQIAKKLRNELQESLQPLSNVLTIPNHQLA